MIRRLYTWAWLVALPRVPRPRRLPAVSVWLVVAVAALWLLAIIAHNTA